jgi:cell fate (sporulation/competence/biofilm development) regulator YlbF (YheA/YmcA/DUF963 family)
MSLKEIAALDMSTILLQSYDLADMINASAEVADYLYWKNQMAEDTDAKILIREFARKKDLFEECERFGHFHPDYHAALEQVQRFQEQMDANTVISRYRNAEEKVDELLYLVSKTIAEAVSESIKVPSNQLAPEGGNCSTGSCSSGGSCSGGCG